MLALISQMHSMQVRVGGGALAFFATMFVGGCGTSSTTSAAPDGGTRGPNPAGCPATAPADTAACDLLGATTCHYGCAEGGPADATCTSGRWSVSALTIACDSADAASGCRSDGDCRAPQEYCATSTPGGIAHCGGTTATTCEVDGDCADAGYPSFICESYLCPAGTGQACFPACTEAACGPTDETGLVCASDGRCRSKSCQAPSDCPTNFDCDAHQCRRRTCTTDAACQGYCVNGSCASALGTCELPQG